MLPIRFSVVLILIVSTLAIINGQSIIEGDHQHRVKRQNPPKGGMGKGGILGLGLMGAGMAVPFWPKIKEKAKQTFGG